MRVDKRPDILDDGKALRVILCRRGHVFWLRTLEKWKQTFSKATKSLADLFHLVEKGKMTVMF